MAVNPEITILLDLYGEILTPKERDTLEYYYNDDLSLKEIADNETAERRMRRDLGYEDDMRDSITRQGVRDNIKRAEAKLIDIDSKLRLIDRAKKQTELCDAVRKRLAAIEDFNMKHGCYYDISSSINHIYTLLSELEDMCFTERMKYHGI